MQNSKFILLFILTVSSAFGQNVTNPLPALEKEVIQCIKENSNEEVNCYKEYYQELQFWETEVFDAVFEMLSKDKTEDEKTAFTAKQTAWKESTYWFFTKTMKEFQKKHPNKFVWDKDPKLKADAIVFYQKNTKYYIDRISYLLSLVAIK
ncbi:MAG: hypothetical protein CFE23_02160 [Flavobacterium sp. BFFFF1]|uniref:hypothetical protein n=1 Tax=unclassified Flavobacterium TaxID=196869 RepID=UPI000BD86CDB|nr:MULTISPECIES: hypothetical protein [unclassified Flavobacterium]OYU81710.1 MAG: hypothetical protein CFE23_02160 [Flavobacterium sp. BFFFF1]